MSSYDIESGVSNLYVLTTAAATEPETPEATNTRNPALTVQKVGIRQGGGGPTGTIDGIRVASSWTSIMSNEVNEDIVTGAKKYDTVVYTYKSGKWQEASDGIYLLTAADYNYIVESLGSKYPTETANMASYGNFNGFSWTSGMILEAIAAVVMHNDPSAAEGQKYSVTYSIYDGSTHDSTIHMILEGGVWVLQK